MDSLQSVTKNCEHVLVRQCIYQSENMRKPTDFPTSRDSFHDLDPPLGGCLVAHKDIPLRELPPPAAQAAKAAKAADASSARGMCYVAMRLIFDR